MSWPAAPKRLARSRGLSRRSARREGGPTRNRVLPSNSAEARMRTLVHLAILTALAGTAPASLAAQDHDFNISTRTDGPVRSCSDLQMTWDGQPAATSVDTLTASGGELSVHAPKNGGIYILGTPGRS